MRKAITIFLIVASNSIFAQEFLNLGFEQTIKKTDKPETWYSGHPPYKINVDTIHKIELNKSLKIESETSDENSFGFISNVFPYKFVKGKSIELRGKIKTENVQDGYAGLWINAKNEDGSRTFDNMNTRGLTGSNEWTDVSIKLDIKNSVNDFTFGGLLTGKGKAWFDGFEIFIEGQKFKNVKQHYSEPTKDELGWLKRNIHTLKTFEINNENDDLEVLNQLVGESEIVALGENTHGSSEIFKMKHRLVKYLNQNNGFDIFSIEANMSEAYAINEYITGGDGNARDLIRGMYFWTWQTKEVFDMVNWMKLNNKLKQNIQFTGFDLQDYSNSLNIIENAFRNNPTASSYTFKLRQKLLDIKTQRDNTSIPILTSDDRTVVFDFTNLLRVEIENLDSLNIQKDWLKQNVRLIEQYTTISDKRDKYMAENVLWIKSKNPNTKLILWAHNNHIKESGNTMGKYLADELKSKYLSIGFTFYDGSYTAINDNRLSKCNAQQAPIGSYEYIFHKMNDPIFLLNLKQLKKENPELSQKVLNGLLFRNVGAIKTHNEFYTTDLMDDFDMIIFINKSTDTKLLD